MRTRLPGAAVAALALVAAAGAATPKWTLLPDVPLPGGAASAQLQGISVVSPQDIWTAGAWWTGLTVHPMVQHWSGTAWAAADLPELPANSYLGAVDAVGASNVWAVGSTVSDISLSPPSVVHYDGSSWRTVATPAPPAGVHIDLDGLDMRTADDGWAVGEAVSDDGPELTAEPLVYHWRAGRWSVAPVPRSAPLSGGLVAVAAPAADDVWAVGTENPPGDPYSSRGLVLHFDGRKWSSAGPSTPIGTTLNAVAVAGPGDVWAVGQTCGDECTAAVWHLTGCQWRPVPVHGGTDLLSVVARSPKNVWVLGYQELDGDKKADHVERWNGSTFTAEETGLPPTSGPPFDHRNELGSATPIWAADADPASGQLWAVGWSNPPLTTPRVIHRG
jgi:hypothetical protein